MDKAFSQFQNKQQPKKLESEVDHTKISYEPFRKNFYVEVSLSFFTAWYSLHSLVADYSAVKWRLQRNIRLKNAKKFVKNTMLFGI